MCNADAPLGISNDIPFEVTDLPQFVESEPNDSPDEANLVQLPVEISGSTDRAADEDFFRFRLPYKQVYQPRSSRRPPWFTNGSAAPA